MQDYIITHVSFAMIPLDAKFTNSSTVSLFKENKDRFSILIHGNDHIREELALSQPSDFRRNIFLQALNRISNFEKRTGFRGF